MTDTTIPYTGDLPLSGDFISAHEGERISVEYLLSLDDLLAFDHIEGMNDYLDAVTGVILTDISYRITYVDDDGQTLTIRAEGVIEP